MTLSKHVKYFVFVITMNSNTIKSVIYLRETASRTMNRITKVKTNFTFALTKCTFLCFHLAA